MENKDYIEILYNNSFGEFGVSDEVKDIWKDEEDDKHFDLELIEIFKKLGSKRTSGKHSSLKLIKLEYDTQFPKYIVEASIQFEDYGGKEHVIFSSAIMIDTLLDINYFKSLEDLYKAREIIKQFKFKKA